MITTAPLSQEHFDAILALGNRVHGDNYLDPQSLQSLFEKSWQRDINASWIALSEPTDALVEQRASQRVGNRYLVGFRLTIAPQHWQPDEWCTPQLWSVDCNDVCYFKCNTVDELMQGQGIGSAMLKCSVDSSIAQGASAGLAHIWLASPGNSAFKYFRANGAELIKEHPNKWQSLSVEAGYECPVCPSICHCTAAEMLLRFDNKY